MKQSGDSSKPYTDAQWSVDATKQTSAKPVRASSQVWSVSVRRRRGYPVGRDEVADPAGAKITDGGNRAMREARAARHS